MTPVHSVRATFPKVSKHTLWLLKAGAQVLCLHHYTAPTTQLAGQPNANPSRYFPPSTPGKKNKVIAQSKTPLFISLKRAMPKSNILAMAH